MYSANVICLQPLLVDLLECVALIECSYMWSYFGSQLLSIALDWQNLFKREEISSRSFQSSCDCVEQTLEMCDGLGGATSGILLPPLFAPPCSTAESGLGGHTERASPSCSAADSGCGDPERGSLHAPLLTLDLGDIQRVSPPCSTADLVWGHTQRCAPLHAHRMTLDLGTHRAAPLHDLLKTLALGYTQRGFSPCSTADFSLGVHREGLPFLSTADSGPRLHTEGLSSILNCRLWTWATQRASPPGSFLPRPPILPSGL